MALEQVCGISKEPYMLGPHDCMMNNIKHCMKQACSNLDNPYALFAPPFENPAVNLADLQRTSERTGMCINFVHGTTTLGFKYQGGIILAVDSRATGGQYVGSQTMKKIVEINEFMLGTMAGGAADCIYWDRVLTKESRLHELRNKQRITVAAASRSMSNIAHEYKGMGLSMGMMLAGADKRGTHLYYMDSEGSRSTANVFAVGSGSIYALGVLDTGYHWDLFDEEAQELGRRAIYHATKKDIFSGGIVRVYHVHPKGWKDVSSTDCMDLHYEYANENENENFEDSATCIQMDQDLL